MAKKTKKDKEVAFYKKKIGITISGVKKYLNDEGYRINNENTKTLIIAIGNGLTSKRILSKDSFLREIFKLDRFMRTLNKKTISAKDIDNFESIRYL